MTTHVASPPGETPRDPYPNKAIAAGVTAAVTVLAQYLESGEVNFGQEGITAIGGALATGLVWYVNNWRRKGR